MKKKETETARKVTAPRKRSSPISSKCIQPLEQRQNAASEATTDFNWYWNISTGQVRYSKEILALLGSPRAKPTQEKTLLKGIVHAGDVVALESRLQAFLAGETWELDSECRLQAKTGGYKRCRIHGKVVERDNLGLPLACAGTILDIHTQKTTRGELAKSHAPLATVFKAALAKSHAPLSAVFQAADDAIWVVEPNTFALVEFNKAFEEMLFRACGVRACLGMHVEEVSPAVAEKLNQFYRDALKHGQFHADYQITETMETIHVALRCLVRGDGVVSGIAGFGHNVTDRARIERALRKSEEKFSALFHHSPLAVMLTSTLDDRYIEVNEAFEAWTGYERNEVIGKNPTDIGLWVTAEHRLKMKEELKATGHARVEIAYRTKSGEVRVAIGSASLIEIEGEPCMLATATDITERVRAEEALRKSEEKYSALAHQRSVAVVVTSMLDDRYLEVNEAFEHATGYKQNEVIGKTPIDIEIWENPNERLKFKERLMANGNGHVEFNYRTKAGEIRPSVGSAVVIDIDGKSCMIGLAIDISGRRRAETALRESEERLRIAIDSVRMCAFEWDPETDALQCSAECGQVLDIDAKDMNLTKAEFTEWILPEDREQFRHTIKLLSPENTSYRMAFRWQYRDQKMIWLEESGRAFFEPDGRLRKVVGMVFDVTDARKSEHLLRELSGRLINSQEEERRRLARELHDQVGQELALLCVQAQRLNSGASDVNHTAHADIHELYSRIKQIAVDVSQLSHRLHSSELVFLGLPSAAERLCRDFKNQYKIDMDYQINDIPTLDKEKSLCFYRILQEALQNVAKHSHATRVEVEIFWRNNELILKVCDNGVGIDPNKALFDSGLGLISMRERLYLIGGRMEITSGEGEGMCLLATVGIPNGDRSVPAFPAAG